MDAIFEILFYALKYFIVFPIWFVCKTIQSGFNILFKKFKKNKNQLEVADYNEQINYFGKQNKK